MRSKCKTFIYQGSILIVFVLQAIFLQAQQKEKLNVLFIISDDLTVTSLSSYENSAGYSPNIDKLAAEGVKFNRAYSQYPVCGPSRASLMFGYYPHATKSFGYISGRENVGEERQSWPQLFKNNGYYTARVSKIYHMGIPTDIEKGTDGTDDPASWDETFNVKALEWKEKGEAELVQNNPYGEIERKGGNVMTIVKAEGDDLVHADAQAAEKASELLRKHKDKPFFLAVGLVRPHVPFVAPKRFFDHHPYDQIVLPPTVHNDWDDIPAAGINYITSVNSQMSEEQEKKAIAGYYSTVTFMDEQVGKVLKTLKEEGLEDNTIVIFTSDHGFHLGEHRFWMKVSLKEESVRVPFIIKMPGKEPKVSTSLVELLDLYPTIAKLAGLEVPEHIQGKDIGHLLDNPEEEVRDYAFSVTQNKGVFGFLIRSKKWAFIQYAEDGSKGMELFDMEHDEKQFNNLAYNPKYKEIVDEYRNILKEKLKEVRTNDLGIEY